MGLSKEVQQAATSLTVNLLSHSAQCGVEVADQTQPSQQSIVHTMLQVESAPSRISPRDNIYVPMPSVSDATRCIMHPRYPLENHMATGSDRAFSDVQVVPGNNPGGWVLQC